MLLVIDVGNTNIVLGSTMGAPVVDNWRIWTERDGPVMRYGILVRNLFSSRSLSFEEIDGIAFLRCAPCRTCCSSSPKNIFSASP